MKLGSDEDVWAFVLVSGIASGLAVAFPGTDSSIVVKGCS